MSGGHVGTGQQQAALGQAAARLVHGYGGQVSPRLHGGHGQVLVKIEVGAVGLVGQAEHPVSMGQLYNGLQVGADAVVGRVVHQHRLGVRVFPDGPLHLADLHAQGDAQAVITLRVDVDRDGAAQHHSAHNAAVYVAGQDDLLSALDRREHHALHSAGGAAHHQEGVGRAKGVRSQLLRIPYDRHGVAQVVQGLHGVDVHAYAGLAQQTG